MLVSGGVTVKNAVVWSGSPANIPDWMRLSSRWSSYASLYREQLWVSVVVGKRARAVARLPLKVYERGVDGRSEARGHPYRELLARPNDSHDPFKFWQWVSSTRDVYGEAFLGKIRDAGGRPVALVPLHPTAMFDETDEVTGKTVWRFETGRVRFEGIPDSDLVHFSDYNPLTLVRGMSALEPLRATLENEDAARRATSAFWRNGARPSVLLQHPSNITQGAQDRLKAQWDVIHAGVDNFARTAILEEGMSAQVVQLSAEDSQYVETRKLNREEVCAAYDIPPPVVHILDHATFSNITEQMRSMYRDTMAPILGSIESVLEFDLRSARRPGASEPDFGDEVYAEFLMDEVLRGAFEVRTPAMAAAIQTGQMTPNEARKLENRPSLPGGDDLLVNAALVPLRLASEGQPNSMLDQVTAAGALVRAGYDPDAALPYVGLDPLEHSGLLPVTVQPPKGLEPAVVRSLMGRLSWQRSLSEIDVETLTAGLNGETPLVLAELDAAKAAGVDVAGFKTRLRSLTKESG